MSARPISADIERSIPTFGLRPAPEDTKAKCEACHDTGYYFDSDGHGGLSWKRPCHYCAR